MTEHEASMICRCYYSNTNPSEEDTFLYTEALKFLIGETGDALALYGEARKNLSYRIRLNPFFGNLNIMRRMIGDIYRLKPFDSKNFSLYDLYYVLAQPARVRFLYAAEPYEVRSVEEDGGVVISFDGKWYRTADDFFAKAALDGELLTTLYMELTDFEVLECAGAVPCPGRRDSGSRAG